MKHLTNFLSQEKLFGFSNPLSSLKYFIVIQKEHTNMSNVKNRNNKKSEIEYKIMTSKMQQHTRLHMP